MTANGYGTMRSVRLTILAALLLTACGESRQGVGTVTSIIVLTTDSVWAAVGDSILAALEPRIFTVRDERTFEVTQVSPQDPNWQDLRRFRRILTVGTAADGWVQPALPRGRDAGQTGVIQEPDVWARNQLVTAIVLPPGAEATAALPYVEQAAQAIDSTFRTYVVQRMYLSLPDTALRDSLRRRQGFGILLPNVYQPLPRDPTVALFQSSTQVGGDLVRSILVTSRDGLVPLTPEFALEWRDSIASEQYNPALISVRDRIQSQPLQLAHGPGVEVQGVWEGQDPTWPMGGPFIARVVHCPDRNRSYLLDAWLYSPGRQKYEYMIQLQTILSTFECA
ncbi:hypothetical protein BH23GEM9_BH23GEM9_34930 [soil metagenome]